MANYNDAAARPRLFAPYFLSSVQERRGALTALMPISHLSGRARYTINLEVSALCLKLLGEKKIVVKCRVSRVVGEMQVISVIQLPMKFAYRIKELY